MAQHLIIGWCAVLIFTIGGMLLLFRIKKAIEARQFHEEPRPDEFVMQQYSKRRET